MPMIGNISPPVIGGSGGSSGTDGRAGLLALRRAGLRGSALRFPRFNVQRRNTSRASLWYSILVKRCAIRVLATLAGVWLVAFGVLGARHEAQVAHHIDVRSGRAIHATSLVGDHTSRHSDVHARVVGSDADACELLTVLHQAASAAFSAPTLACRPHDGRTVACAVSYEAVASRRVYRLAPKTSPPQLA
jgi:hypothetical protein